MKHAMEVTTFKLNKGHDLNDFIQVNVEIDQWLKKQPGFGSRQIGQRDDGYIVDTLIWNSVAQGTAAMNRLMKEFSDSPIHSMIDQRTVEWNIFLIGHELKNG